MIKYQAVTMLTLDEACFFASKYVIYLWNYHAYSQNHSLEQNNHLDMHHSQGGIKFATQISPLLNDSWKQYLQCAGNKFDIF